MRGRSRRPQTQPGTGSNHPREGGVNEKLTPSPLTERSRYSCAFLPERAAAGADLQGNVPYRDPVPPAEIARQGEIRGDRSEKTDQQRNFLGSVENPTELITLTY